MFQRRLKKVSRVFCQGGFKRISRKFLGVPRVILWHFREVSCKFQRHFKKVARSSKKVSRVLQENFKGVSRVLQGWLRIVSVRVFQGCSVFESLLLLVTHRSYPSRRRACFIF